MKSLTKGRIKQLLVRWGIMLSPVMLAVVVWAWQIPKAHAMPYRLFRVLFYPDCHPAWAGGTIWQQGICVPNCSSGQQVGPYCETPVPYLPGFMPPIVGTDLRGVMVIDTTTNYCGAGDLYLGFAYTEYSYDNVNWLPVIGSTNAVLQPNGYIESKWQIVPANLTGFGAYIKLGNASPMILCPGGTGSGGQ